MSEALPMYAPSADDPVSNVLKWTLLAVAIICFALLAWTTSPITAHRRSPISL
jgi:hypothetical protein